MTTHTPPAPAGLAEHSIRAAVTFSEQWGRLWFGIIFWGSILHAAAQRTWPDTDSVLLPAGSLLIGAAAGLFAQRRGSWL